LPLAFLGGQGARSGSGEGRGRYSGCRGDLGAFSSGNITDEYVFFGGKRVAHRDSSGNLHYC